MIEVQHPRKNFVRQLRVGLKGALRSFVILKNER